MMLIFCLTFIYYLLFSASVCVLFNVFCTSFHILPNAFNNKFPNPPNTLKFGDKMPSKVEAFSVICVNTIKCMTYHITEYYMYCFEKVFCNVY